MGTQIGQVTHQLTGRTVMLYEGWSWPCFFFGVFWYLVKGMWGAAILYFLISCTGFGWPFALLMGVVVYAAHHKRFVGMLKGFEPQFYINDRMGPRG